MESCTQLAQIQAPDAPAEPAGAAAVRPFAAPGPAARALAVAAEPASRSGDRAWPISLGVAAGHALAERDARRLQPAAGAVMLAVLQSVALARYPHWFGWQSPSGMVYLIFLAAFLLTGAAGLTKGLIRTNQGVLIIRAARETPGFSHGEVRATLVERSAGSRLG